jgi:hypothetical protein
MEDPGASRIRLPLGGARTVLLGAAALAVATMFAVATGRQQEIGSDFAVFWQAGRDFTSGHPLYHDYLPGAREFKYPPFAAFVFQLLGLFSLKTAASLFSLLNIVLWPAAILCVRSIVRALLPQGNLSAIPLVLAVILSAQLFQDNYQHVQMNELVFILVLLGIRNYLRGRDRGAAACFVAATALKVTPVFFLAWLLIRGRRRALLAALVLGLGTIVLPILQRGPAAGVADLAEYFQGFLAAQPNAASCTFHSCQNLGAMVARMMQPGTDPQQPDFQYVVASAHAALITYRMLWVTILLLFLARLVLLRIRRSPLSALEFTLPILTALLLSPITFKAHMVSLLLPYYSLLAIRPATLSARARAWSAATVVAMLVTGLSGPALVGYRVSIIVSGYSVLVWTTLLLFLFAVAEAGNERLSSAGPG